MDTAGNRQRRSGKSRQVASGLCVLIALGAGLALLSGCTGVTYLPAQLEIRKGAEFGRAHRLAHVTRPDRALRYRSFDRLVPVGAAAFVVQPLREAEPRSLPGLLPAGELLALALARQLGEMSFTVAWAGEPISPREAPGSELGFFDPLSVSYEDAVVKILITGAVSIRVEEDDGSTRARLRAFVRFDSETPDGTREFIHTERFAITPRLSADQIEDPEERRLQTSLLAIRAVIHRLFQVDRLEQKLVRHIARRAT